MQQTNQPMTAVVARSRSRRPLSSRVAAMALALAASFGAGRAAMAAGVLDKVPADAMVVVKFSDLAATSQKFGKLATDLGLDMFQPQLADPLGALKQELKIEKGLDDHGELAIVLLDPSKHEGDEDKATLILVPTNDYAGLVGNLEGAKTEGTITTVTRNGTEMYIADWGGYAAQSKNRALVETAPTEFVKPSERALKELKDNDITIFANIANVRGPLTEQIDKQNEESKQNFLEGFRRGQRRGAAAAGDNNAGDGEKASEFEPVVSAAYDQGINAVKSFLRDADAATVGLTFVEGGIREQVVADFKPDSYLGKMTSGLKGSDQPVLAGLPAEKYLAFGGAVVSADVVNKLVDDFAGPIVAAIPAQAADGGGEAKVDAAMAKSYLDGLKSYLSNVDRMSFGLVTPTGAFGQEGIFQVISNTQGNADAIVTSLRDFNEKNAELNAILGSGGAPGVKLEQTWTRDAKKVGDVTFDTVTSNFLGDTPQANQMRQQIQFIYGNESIETLVGKVDDKNVISFVNVKEPVMQQAIAAAKAGDAPLAAFEHVKGVSSQMPGNRIAEMYISVDEIASTGLRFANQMGFFQGNVQLPPDLPPIGLVLSSEGSSIQGSAYVSSDLLQALVSAGMQLSQRRQGRGGGL